MSKIHKAADLLTLSESLFLKKPTDMKKGKGGKSLSIQTSDKDTSLIYVKLQAETEEPHIMCPFGVSEPYDDSKTDENRRGVVLQLDPVLAARFQDFENVLVRRLSELTQESNDYFGKAMDETQIRSVMTSVVSRDSEEKYPPGLRTKINLAGKYKVNVKYVNSEGQYRKGTHADITKFCQVTPVIRMCNIWIVNRKWGVALELSHALVWEVSDVPEDVFDMGECTASAEDALPGVNFALASDGNQPPESYD